MAYWGSASNIPSHLERPLEQYYKSQYGEGPSHNVTRCRSRTHQTLLGYTYAGLTYSGSTESGRQPCFKELRGTHSNVHTCYATVVSREDCEVERTATTMDEAHFVQVVRTVRSGMYAEIKAKTDHATADPATFQTWLRRAEKFKENAIKHMYRFFLARLTDLIVFEQNDLIHIAMLVSRRRAFGKSLNRMVGLEARLIAAVAVVTAAVSDLDGGAELGARIEAYRNDPAPFPAELQDTLSDLGASRWLKIDGIEWARALGGIHAVFDDSGKAIMDFSNELGLGIGMVSGIERWFD